ncbi:MULTISPECIES: hypothetical protein [unclassified Acidovorax]|uniref:hypothetical protein n=1 Tax=unclassified Acidovorax TaxID=2684926 RepID=UPI001C49534E|nr:MULTISPECIES: hypothetical protein [unclassified Acidovorax]MBV7431696.1 hypothetical protein [Acidovorax sp. sif0732]MBV7452820.1 hypothetical protein [Acidovorax sp. sif0715]
MKFSSLFLLICIGLSACDQKMKEPQEKTLLQEMMRERAVVYSKSPNTNKIPHDELWLVTGEVVAVKSGVIEPRSNFVASMFDDKERERMVKKKDGFDVFIDRDGGRACLNEKCVDIFYICKNSEPQETCKYFR